MDDQIGNFGGLEYGLIRGRNAISSLAATTSRAATGTGVNTGPEAPAADLARAALFQEAVIGAIKSHVKELKTVTQK